MTTNKRILFLAAYFSPEKAASNYLFDNLIEDAIKCGFSFLVITPYPTRGISKKRKKQTKKTELLFDGKLRIKRFWMFDEYKHPILRALRYFLCALIHFTKAISARNVDLIFVTSTPPFQGALAALIKRVKRIPVVYNLQDIFPESLTSTGLAQPDSVLWKIGTRIERFSYSNSTQIITISDSFKDNLLLKKVPENKIKVVYNWVDEKEVFPIERKENKIATRLKIGIDKFVITYSGNIGLTQNIPILIQVAISLNEYADIQFVIIGDGVFKPDLIKLIDSHKLNNITLLDFQPYEDIAHVFSLGDAGLIISKKNVGSNSVPSKAWSIMSAGRAVIASFDKGSELEKIIQSSDAGLLVDADDHEALTSSILTIYNNRELCFKLGNNGRNYILNNLTRAIGTSQYIEVFQKLNYEKR